MKSEKEIEAEFPLHYSIWTRDLARIRDLLNDENCDIEIRDPRGRTPLMLAVTLGYTEPAKLLVRRGANIDVENKEGWTVVQEATAQANPELLSVILGKRDSQRHATRMHGVPALLQKLKEAPDFYVEMKWEFTSWVPLVSRMCPSDTYKIYKQGSNVRIDTTLLGFDQNSWQRGSRSFMFKGESENKAVLMEINHETRDVYIEELRTEASALELADTLTAPSPQAVEARITTPIVNTFLDIEKISFERNKTGLWGWRSDKLEQVNGYDCKVFSATNVHLVTKTRTEHLREDDKTKVRNHRFPLQSLLTSSNADDSPVTLETNGKKNEAVTLAEYFDPSVDLQGRDIGQPKEISSKIQKFKLIIYFLMLNAKIPLFHVMSACVTFGNIFAAEEPVTGITQVNEADRVYCFVDDSCFEIPASYTSYGMDGAEHGRRQFSMDEEDGILQYAIQQSLLETGTENDQVDIWEALMGSRPSEENSPSPRPARASSSLGIPMSSEEQELQRAIEASLGITSTADLTQWAIVNNTGTANDEDEALARAIALSARESEESRRRALEEDEMLERILQLSLLEK
nr:EOG090X0784 [Eulimnadia texana]